MKIFHRSLIREFSTLCLGVGLVLISIALIRLLILLLGRAATGNVEPEGVTALLGFSMLSYLPVIVVPSVFVAVLLALSRSYRDSEMSVWFSSGLSLMAWVNPVVRFGLPLSLITAILSFFLTPWALSESMEYQRLLRSRDEISRLSPGSFIESRGANRVFFVDKTTDESEVVNNVFVQYNQSGRFGVVVAEKGFQQIEPNGDKFLVLLKGRRYEGTPGGLDFRIMDFERQMLRVEARQAKSETASSKARSTFELIRNPIPDHLAELHWRAALPISVILLALCAIPLSFVNPRSGQSWNLILAILVFMFYYNLLNIFQAWTAQGRLSPWIGLWPVHLIVAFILLAVFSRQFISLRLLGFVRK